MHRLGLYLVGVVSVLPAMVVTASLHAQTLETLPFDKKLKLAKAGDEEAQIAVALAYEQGTETEANRAEAAKWYRKAADHGNIDAQFRLAQIVGQGAPGLKKNPELAAKLYESAARQGHSEAQNWLGYSYQHGLGVAQSDTSAIQWYRKAADSGLAVAQNNLGLMFLNGKGVPRDYSKAFTLFEQAAKQNDAWGLNNLGGLYEMGWGVKQDRRKALDYYRQAFTRGNAHAGQNMKRLATALGSEPATASVEPTASKPEIETPLKPKTPPEAVQPAETQPKAAETQPKAVETKSTAVETKSVETKPEVVETTPEVKATVIQPQKKKAVKSDSSGDQ